MRPESGFWIALNWPEIEKIKMTSQVADITSSSVFLRILFSGSRIVKIYFYKGLTRNPEIRNTTICVLPNI